jgi:hypothetical protein
MFGRRYLGSRRTGSPAARRFRQLWFDLTPDHGVLELHDRLTAGIGLEPHIVVCSDDTNFAWWESEDGDWPGSRRSVLPEPPWRNVALRFNPRGDERLGRGAPVPYRSARSTRHTST